MFDIHLGCLNDRDLFPNTLSCSNGKELQIIKSTHDVMMSHDPLPSSFHDTGKCCVHSQKGFCLRLLTTGEICKVEKFGWMLYGPEVVPTILFWSLILWWHIFSWCPTKPKSILSMLGQSATQKCQHKYVLLTKTMCDIMHMFDWPELYVANKKWLKDNNKKRQHVYIWSVKSL